MPSDKKKLHKLSDIEVETVGLVTFGANQKPFFLLKSHQEDNVMPNEDANVQGVQADETFWDRIKKTIRGEIEAVANADDGSGDEVPAEGEGQTDVVQKMNDQMVELRKANEALLDRLEKAEKKAEEEEEKREKQEYVEKASVLDKLPVKAEELAGHLREVYKADAGRGEYFLTLLKSVNELLKDTKVFEEVGTSESDADDGEPISVQKLSDLAKSGDAEAIRKAMLSMDEDDAWKLIEAERKRIIGA